MDIPCEKTFLLEQNFLSCDLDLQLWPTFEKGNLGLNFWTRRDRAFILHVYFLWGDLSVSTKTLTFEICMKHFTFGAPCFLISNGVT